MQRTYLADDTPVQTVIPKGAAVKVTDSESVTDPSDPSDGPHYADHDLRRDLLILALS